MKDATNAVSVTQNQDIVAVSKNLFAKFIDNSYLLMIIERTTHTKSRTLIMNGLENKIDGKMSALEIKVYTHTFVIKFDRL